MGILDSLKKLFGGKTTSSAGPSISAPIEPRDENQPPIESPLAEPTPEESVPKEIGKEEEMEEDL